MSEIYDFELKAGATYPPLQIQLVNENNSAVDLTGVKGIKFFLRSTIGQAMITSAATATCTNSVLGYLQYTWKKADTSGLDNTIVEATFRATLSNNSIMKVPENGYLKGYIGDALS